MPEEGARAPPGKGQIETEESPRAVDFSELSLSIQFVRFIHSFAAETFHVINLLLLIYEIPVRGLPFSGPGSIIESSIISSRGGNYPEISRFPEAVRNYGILRRRRRGG
jgi:hypothetical protein